ncbi:MAG: DNA cytosine methyltransferase [Pseudonocardiaceae bacterium]
MTPALTIGGLFEGYGGLTMGVQAALGGRLAWYSEIDPAANKVLARHHPDVPNLGDVTTVDWTRVERPDILTGGFPCADVSTAGRREGLRKGNRSGLWRSMADAIEVLRPDLVVVENVRGLLSTRADGDLEPCAWCVGDERPVVLRALGRVLGDLADIGFDAEWRGLPASWAGAPHGRFRVFIIAWPAGHPPYGLGGYPETGRGDWGRLEAQADALLPTPDAYSAHRGGAQSPERRRAGNHSVTLQDEVVARPPIPELLPTPKSSDGTHGGPNQRGSSGDLPLPSMVLRLSPTQKSPAGRGGPAPAEPPVQWGRFEPAIRRWERILGRPSPPPAIAGKRGARRLSHFFVEWMMGLNEGHVTAVPDVPRNDALRILGNGVVPMQAAMAVSHLLSRL